VSFLPVNNSWIQPAYGTNFILNVIDWLIHSFIHRESNFRLIQWLSDHCDQCFHVLFALHLTYGVDICRNSRSPSTRLRGAVLCGRSSTNEVDNNYHQKSFVSGSEAGSVRDTKQRWVTLGSIVCQGSHVSWSGCYARSCCVTTSSRRRWSTVFAHWRA